jgi:hypothetical protein
VTCPATNPGAAGPGTSGAVDVDVVDDEDDVVGDVVELGPPTADVVVDRRADPANPCAAGVLVEPSRTTNAVTPAAAAMTAEATRTIVRDGRRRPRRA